MLNRVVKVAQTLCTVSFVLAFGFANNAFASTHNTAHEVPGISSLIWPLINFSIYIFLMNFLYKKYGKPALIARAVSFEQAAKKADSVLEEVEKQHRALQDRLKNIKIEEEEIRNRINNETEFEINSLINAAHNEAKQVTDDVQRRIEQEISKVNIEVKTLVITQAMKKAEEKLKNNLSKEQDYSLRQNTVRSMLS